jgi:hypothetical protein
MQHHVPSFERFSLQLFSVERQISLKQEFLKKRLDDCGAKTRGF